MPGNPNQAYLRFAEIEVELHEKRRELVAAEQGLIPLRREVDALDREWVKAYNAMRDEIATNAAAKSS